MTLISINPAVRKPTCLPAAQLPGPSLTARGSALARADALVRRARLARGLTQQELAGRLEMERSYLSKLEL
jgi:hypothetical protein